MRKIFAMLIMGLIITTTSLNCGALKGKGETFSAKLLLKEGWTIQSSDKVKENGI